MSTDSRHRLAANVALLKTRASKHSIYGVLIAFIAILIATALVCYVDNRVVTLDGLIAAQKSNVALWLMDAMPFVFALWGQYVSSMIVYEAGALVVDQTDVMRAKAEAVEQRAMHNITHDAVTGCPNRVLLQDRLDQAVQNAKRDESMVGLLLLDLDRFKEINDSLGYDNGDKLLRQVAVRLRGVVRENDTVARMGDDEFTVLIATVESVADVINFAEGVELAFRTPFVLDSVPVEVRASIGVTVFPSHGDESEALIQRAEIAMKVSKKNRKGHVVYSARHDSRGTQPLVLITELRQAIESNGLTLFYQPKIELASGTIVGTEALARWMHPERGEIPPTDFIPIAERTGLIKPLTLWALKKAIRQAARWRRQDKDLLVAVNISAQDLIDAELVDFVAGMLAAQRLNPNRLTLEITESTIMADQRRALEIMHRLSEMGVNLAIDDFGTGYSSLSYLSELPVTELKIDKSFVIDMANNAKHAMIVRATVDLAHNLGLKVVAEGTATRAAYDKLRALECDYAQGEYIGNPLAVDGFYKWAANGQFSEHHVAVDDDADYQLSVASVGAG
ncbi:MAG: EAL domain-containing protein [Gammaproteobacteria bacterium]|nr:EAL domain-containing protein [Gammaproteobacteria bacterium]MDH3468045.1 EAL domain-containing protein [Gammaproteobacteria bacterium]